MPEKPEGSKAPYDLFVLRKWFVSESDSPEIGPWRL